jgi:hypothetical protein
MFSGLERKQAVQRRQQSVAWAWTKARNTMKDQTKATHAKLTSSVLLSSESAPGEGISNWRDSLAALNHRSLARQICEQVYDLAILAAWRERSAEVTAAERAFNAALPAYCQDAAKPLTQSDARQPARKSLMTTSVLPDQQPHRGAVLIRLRPRAA